jgi:hypothetical protein
MPFYRSRTRAQNSLSPVQLISYFLLALSGLAFTGGVAGALLYSWPMPGSLVLSSGVATSGLFSALWAILRAVREG